MRLDTKVDGYPHYEINCDEYQTEYKQHHRLERYPRIDYVDERLGYEEKRKMAKKRFRYRPFIYLIEYRCARLHECQRVAGYYGKQHLTATKRNINSGKLDAPNHDADDDRAEAPE